MSGRANLRPVGPGNTLSRQHGVHATVTLAGRADEIAADLRAVVPAMSPADEPLIRLCALVLARVEAANLWLHEHGLTDRRGSPRTMLKYVTTAENSAQRMLDRLGCSPLSRAQLGLDVARARGKALRSHLAEHYPEET